MKSKLFFILTSALFALLCVSSLFMGCEHELPAPVNQGQNPATFSSIQANILTPNCVNRGCHPGGAAPFSLLQGVAYQNLVNVPSAYGNLLRVSPGDPDNSVLYLKVIGDAQVGGANGRMPLGFNPLSNDDIQAIRDWITNGANND